MSETWNTNWDHITNDTMYEHERKMVHKNGGNFLSWSAMRAEDGNGFYVAAVVREQGERPIIWGPRLAEQYLRLVPNHLDDKGKISILTSSIRNAIEEMEPDSVRRNLESALTKIGKEI